MSEHLPPNTPLPASSSTAAAGVAAPVKAAWVVRLNDYVELLKPRLTGLVLLTVAGGFVMGSGVTLAYGALAHVLVGMVLVVGGGATLNQYLERSTDGLMRRTQNRPLPASRMTPNEVLYYGAILAIAGLVYLGLYSTVLVMLLSALAAGIYLLAYTPLKTRTVWNTMVGGVTGALPPMIGWAAASGRVTPGAWALFWILFVWQMPHFFALSWCFKDDYQAAGIRMVSGLNDGGRAVMSLVLLFALALVPVSLMPWTTGAAGGLYCGSAAVLSVVFLGLCVRLFFTRARRDAWWVFGASIAYLPILFGVMLYDRLPAMVG
ncbi:MAG TPA: heme o synthase [Planctomycetota bacterium]|nr:heme o synthase [Planctomycetota bacterium]